MSILKDLIFVKLGSSIIADIDNERTLNIKSISRSLNEIISAKIKNDFNIIIGYGSGSYTHIPAFKYKLNEGLKYKDSRIGALIACNLAKKLNFLIVEEAIKLGIELCPFSPSSFAYADNDILIEGEMNNIDKAIDSGFIPIVYGDVLFDKTKGITIASTEKVLSFMAHYFKPNRIIIATDVDGVFTSNPMLDTTAKIIKDIDNSNIDDVLGNIKNEANKPYDVTGGMKTEVSDLYNMVKDVTIESDHKCEGYIINGNREGILNRTLRGDYIFTSTKIKYIK